MPVPKKVDGLIIGLSWNSGEGEEFLQGHSTSFPSATQGLVMALGEPDHINLLPLLDSFQLIRLCSAAMSPPQIATTVKK